MTLSCRELQGEQNGEIRLKWNTKFEFQGYLEILGVSRFYPTVRPKKKEHTVGAGYSEKTVGTHVCTVQ